MIREELVEKIKQDIAQQLRIDKSSITDTSTLDTLGADSVDRVHIVMKLEEDFDIEINDDDADKFSTIHDIVNYVDRLTLKQ